MAELIGTLKRFDPVEHAVVIGHISIRMSAGLYDNVASHFQVGDVVKAIVEQRRITSVSLHQLRKE